MLIIFNNTKTFLDLNRDSNNNSNTLKVNNNFTNNKISNNNSNTNSFINSSNSINNRILIIIKGSRGKCTLGITNINKIPKINNNLCRIILINNIIIAIILDNNIPNNPTIPTKISKIYI